LITKTGKRNKVNTGMSKSDEKGKYMSMLEKLQGKEGMVNLSKAAGFAQVTRERMNKQKASKGNKGGKVGKTSQRKAKKGGKKGGKK
jgi:hypothetical protein